MASADILRASNAQVLEALKAALPFVERVANSRPTEDARRARQRQAVKALASIHAAIAAAEREAGQ